MLPARHDDDIYIYIYIYIYARTEIYTLKHNDNFTNIYIYSIKTLKYILLDEC